AEVGGHRAVAGHVQRIEAHGVGDAGGDSVEDARGADQPGLGETRLECVSCHVAVFRRVRGRAIQAMRWCRRLSRWSRTALTITATSASRSTTAIIVGTSSVPIAFITR